MAGPDTPTPASEQGTLAANTRNNIRTHFEQLNNPNNLSDRANRDGSPFLTNALNNPLFKVDTQKQKDLHDASIQKGKENVVKLIAALRDSSTIQNKDQEISKLSDMLGIDVSKYMNPDKDTWLATSEMKNEDKLYDVAYYGVDAQIARWNGTPSSPTNEQDAGAAVAANEEQK